MSSGALRQLTFLPHKCGAPLCWRRTTRGSMGGVCPATLHEIVAGRNTRISPAAWGWSGRSRSLVLASAVQGWDWDGRSAGRPREGTRPTGMRRRVHAQRRRDLRWLRAWSRRPEGGGGTYGTGETDGAWRFGHAGGLGLGFFGGKRGQVDSTRPGRNRTSRKVLRRRHGPRPVTVALRGALRAGLIFRGW
jgi:hypothetical protein